MNPVLGALGNNGGPTSTMLPLGGSPAINAATAGVFPLSNPSADQRGVYRPVGGASDLGAVELGCDLLTDADCGGVTNASDNCPTVANGLAQAAVTGVGNQIDGTTAWTSGQLLESAQPFGPVGGGSPPLGDGVGDACDNCRTRRNPRVAPALFATEALFFAANQWATLSGGQRDDDHDGYGNRCDGDFNQAGALIDSADLTQYRPSSGKGRSNLTAAAVHFGHGGYLHDSVAAFSVGRTARAAVVPRECGAGMGESRAWMLALFGARSRSPGSASRPTTNAVRPRSRSSFSG